MSVMPELTRYPNQPPAIKDVRSTELFSHGTDPLPQGRAILVIAADWCGHCHDMERNNNYASETSNGTPVRWMNNATREVHEVLRNIPGVTKNERGLFVVNGTAIDSYPTLVEIVDGKATQILTGTRDITQRGALNEVAIASARASAESQAREAVGDSCKIEAATACTVDPKALPLNILDMKKISAPSPGR